MRRAVFLDRDGVINRAIVREGKPYPPRNLGEMQILPGVLDALSALKQAGYQLIVVTNQPDVARGLISQESVEEIHHCLAQCLPIDAFLTCFHDAEDGCTCRKPLPGALLAAAKKHTLSLEHSYMVGDRWRDIEAGQRAGCKTIFIHYGYKEKQPQSMDYQVGSLGEAATIILGAVT